MANFRGDYNWIHAWEGHVGRPYIPGRPEQSASGITFDPGVDIGYFDRRLFESLYFHLFNEAQRRACRGAYGLVRHAAHAYLRNNPALRSIRISKQQATTIFPAVAQPYWDGTVRRFPNLADPDTPGAVHTAFLSLTYNRGVHNRHLSPLIPLVAAKNWLEVGKTIRRMQQNHSLVGIRNRRRAEGDLILRELERLAQRPPLHQRAPMTPIPPHPPQPVNPQQLKNNGRK